MKKVFVVWLNLSWEATMVRPVVMIICWLLFCQRTFFACCVTHAKEYTPLSQRIKQKRERDNFKELSKRLGFGHFSSQMHDCEKENAS